MHYVAVVGSRTFPHTREMWNNLSFEDKLEATSVGRSLVQAAVKEFPPEFVVVSGGAKGPDSWAVEAAEARGLETIVFEPEWDRYGPSAGFKRNRRIVSKADELLAFWDLASRGTRHSIKLAKAQQKPYYIIGPEGNLYEQFLPA